MMEYPFLGAVPGALVRCGTSRVLALDGAQCPADGELAGFIGALLRGEHDADGLGGHRYQLNKAVVVYPVPWFHGFALRFFQVDGRRGEVISDLECGNAATGAALLAVLLGYAEPNEHGILWGANLGTDRLLRIKPIGDPWSACDWQVGFVYPNGALPRVYSGDEPVVVDVGAPVNLWVVERGNLFIIANVDPEGIDPDVVRTLTDAGTSVAKQLGSHLHACRVPKLLCYSVRGEADESVVPVDAGCFSDGESHASLPGSGVMELAMFLTACRLGESSPEALAGTRHFVVCYQDGSIPVHVDWERRGNEARVTSATFETRARVLMHGAIPHPSGRACG